MSQRGLCSRREADRFIEQGLVRVDGEIISTLGSKIYPDQDIQLETAALKSQAGKHTVLINKPPGYVSGLPEKGYQSAVMLITSENAMGKNHIVPHRQGLAPAGRLDIDSSGLMVFTQDGRIARQLIGENSEIEKEYRVRVRGQITQEVIKQLQWGLELDGRKLKPATVSLEKSGLLNIILKEGRKRQIRRMCDLVGLEVESLVRTRIGQIKLGKLERGKWRLLNPGERF